MKINILFILPSLRPGGAERVLSFLSQNLDKEQFNASILITGNRSNDDYKIEETQLTYLNKQKVRSAVPGIIHYLNSNEIHIVMSAIGHVNLALGLLSPFYPKIKFIGRETTLSQSNHSEKLSLTGLLRRRIYLFLDVIVCQSEDMKDDFVKKFKFPENKIIVINNPITSNFTVKEQLKKSNTVQLITVGRLDPIKGHLRVLEILKKLSVPFHYTLIGNGPEGTKIKNYIESNDLQNRVTHISFTKEIPKYLSSATLFLQGSYIEGFPNALLESCAVGTPVLAFEAKGGTKEIIVNGKNGFIAKDENEYFTLLNRAIERNWEPVEIRNTVISKFSESVILSHYEALFRRIFNQN